MVGLQLESVTVDFPVYDASTRSVKNRLLHHGTGGRIGHDAGNRLCVRALEDVSLAFKHGERVALVGRNGAGKTTLLRVLVGAYEPTRGRVWRRGRTASLLKVSLGIAPEATGYENIMTRGLFLGLMPEQVRERMDEIAAFTELGDYLAMPVRTYSIGMRLRLAFAVCTCFDPEILLMDEWLSVGDRSFVREGQAPARRIRGSRRDSGARLAEHYPVGACLQHRGSAGRREDQSPRADSQCTAEISRGRVGAGESKVDREGQASGKKRCGRREYESRIGGRRYGQRSQFLSSVCIEAAHRRSPRVLSLVGCDLPKTLMKAVPNNNEAGFWESQPIADLNDEILASAGSAWDDWRSFDSGWHASPVADEFRERAQALLHEEFGKSRLFVLKDPRICRLLPFWNDAIRAFGAERFVVSPIRNPLDVSMSLGGA